MRGQAPPRVSLPMYDLPEVAWATDRLWMAIRERLLAAGIAPVPDALCRDGDLHALWTDPGLLFSQTCGWPLMHRYGAVLEPLATPCYDLPGCEGPLYRSVIVVRADRAPVRSLAALRGSICAVNGWDSQSGWNALAATVAAFGADEPFFAGAVVTGSHAASLAAVAAAKADLAAIDCVTFGLLARYRPAAVAALRVIGETEPVPGLPYVTRRGAPAALTALLRQAVLEVASASDTAEARAALGLVGAEVLGFDAYRPIVAMTARGVSPPERRFNANSCASG